MSKFNTTLRKHLEKRVEETEDSFYSIGRETGIPSQSLYRFRNSGTGISGENAYRLIEYLKIDKRELL